MTAFNKIVETPIHAIAKCINEIVVNDDLELAMQNMVDRMAAALNINCCFITESTNLSNNCSSFSYASQRAFNGVCQLPSLPNLNEFPEILTALNQNQSFKVTRLSSVSKELVSYLKQSNVQCMLLLPIFKGLQLWGCIGFGDNGNGHTFCKNEPELQMLASAIGSAIKNKRVENRQREQYQFLVQSVGQVVFSLDKNASLVHASPAWNDLVGCNQENCLGRPFIEFMHDDHVQIFWSDFGDLLAGHTVSLDRQTQLVNVAGHAVWVRILAKTSLDHNNEIEGVFGTIENIHHSHNEALLLQESSERINTILNNSKEIILTLNLEKNIIASVNDAVEILGYKSEEWVNKSYKSWDDEQRQQFHELVKLAVQNELQVKSHQITFTNKTNTSRIPFEFSTSIYYYKNTRYLLCVLRDIRERLKYEENISLISTQLTHLLSNIDDVYAIYNIATESYDFVSDNIEKLYNCTKQEYCANRRLWRNVIHKEDVAGVEKEVEQLIKNKTKAEIFYRIQTSTGQSKKVLEKLVVGKNANGKADKLYIVKTDYTHIEKAEQSLLETERKFRFISENLSDFISIHDTDWNFTYASPSITNILGFQPEDVIGMGGFDLVHPDDLLKTLHDCIHPLVLYKKESQFRYRMLSKDGKYKWVETYAKPVIDSKGEIASIISSTRDVSDQVNSETKLKESEEKYRLLSENSNDVIGIHNLQKEFLYISPSCKQVLGYEPSELLGKNPQEVYSGYDPLSTSISEANKVLEERKDRKFLSKIVTRNGQQKVLEVWLKPLFKANELIGLQSASRDVTEREKLLSELETSLAKERELNDLRQKFVSTASHQFRTPLTVIQSGVEIMDMYLDDLPTSKQAKFQNQFKKIQEEVSRLENLMNDVLVLGRANAIRTPFHPEKKSLVDFCSAIINNKYNSYYNVERQISFNVTGTEVDVSFDEKLLSHAVENILSNAYKYSSKGNIDFNVVYEARQVTIKITDHGLGIPPDDIKNLFQPFYRATNTNEIDGTGLGLSIVKEFVEIHGGKIFLSSKLNKGTIVSVILPIT